MPFFQGKSDFGKVNPKIRMYCKSPKKLAHKNDILLSVRAPVGDVNIAEGTCCIGRGLAAISGQKEKSYSKYIYYYLLWKKKELENIGVGSTFKAIGKKDIEKILIPLPPLDIQKKIATALDTANALIEKRKEQIEKLDLLIKSQFIEMFGDPVTNPKEMCIRDRPVTTLSAQVFTMQATMPAMTQMAIVAKTYGADSAYAATLSFLTVLLGIVVVPLYMMLVNMYI